MALVNMRDLLQHAYQNQYAVGAFDLVSLDFLEAVVGAAEESRSAVILSIAEPHFEHYDMELMLVAVERAARRASVPVAIQLDHGSSLDSAIRAINLGCNGVMVDLSSHPLPDNIKVTREVVEMAHGCGASVGGELGYVAGGEGEGAEIHPGESAYTSVAEARAYVERTGVDSLAVSIGTVQGHVKGRAKLDIRRLKELNQALGIPLEVHGGSGLSEEQFHKLIANGVAKINYYTALSDVAAEAMRRLTKENPKGSFIELKRTVKEAICEEVKRCLRLWGSAGRAAEVLAQCEPWQPVDDLWLFEGEPLTPQQMDLLVQEGCKLLATMPGVSDCSVGMQPQSSVPQQPRFCWRVRFVSEQARQRCSEDPAMMDLKRRLRAQMDEGQRGVYQQRSLAH